MAWVLIITQDDPADAEGAKIVEETEIGTVTYGQKVDEGLFSAG